MGRANFCSRTLTHRSCWTKGIPMFCPSSCTLYVVDLPHTFHASATGRQGYSCSFGDNQGEFILSYIYINPHPARHKGSPQHLLLRLGSLGLNSHADYNELQNRLILGRKEFKKPNYVYKGTLLSFGLDLYLSWSWSRSLPVISSTLRMKLSIWL